MLAPLAEIRKVSPETELGILESIIHCKSFRDAPINSFTNGETETQRRDVTCSRSLSQLGLLEVSSKKTFRFKKG